MKPLLRLAGLAGALALAACAPVARTPAPGAPTPPPATGAIHVDAVPVPLNPKDPAQTVQDGFRYAGGLWLTSKDTALFGGFSDLKVDAQGRFISESDDGGAILRGRMVLDAAGKLVGVADTRIDMMTGLDGKPMSVKTETDAEGIVQWPNGDVMISFEREHRIWVYPANGGPPHAAPKPDAPEFRDPKFDNLGMEGLARAPAQGADAYWVGIEGGDLYLCHLMGACERTARSIRPALTYRLSGLADAPNGDLVTLNHFYNPIDGSSHVIVSVYADPTGTPRKLGALTLDPPMSVDNFEGVDVVVRPNGDWRFYLIVDDNFAKNERTLLLAFDWTPPPGEIILTGSSK